MAAPTAAGGSRSQTNGVLPVQATQISANGSRQTAAKPSSLKLKLIVRRLAPGLTEEEFLAVLGDEWKIGEGKVDWFLYKAGKDSKDPSKPSRPSRAYLRLTSEAHLLPFSDVVRQSNFEDAQNTFTNSCLIGPPVVEFAPYSRTPGGRRRVDARGGTIDQDPEFMFFLEGLANPVATKDINADSFAESSSGKQEKVTTTPLVQFLKEKKASKNKEAAVKAAKKQEAKGKASSTSPEDAKKKGKETKVEKSVERAAKEAVKILNREAAKAAAEQAEAGPSTASSENGSDPPPPKLDFLAHVPPRHRSAATAAHIRMLQRDLGFSPAQAHRQVKRDTADAQKAERAAAKEKAAAEPKEPTSSQAAQAPTAPTAPKSSSTQSNRKSRNKGSSNESESSKASNAAGPSKSVSSSSNATASGPSIPVILLRKPEATASTPTAPTPQPSKAQSIILARKPQAVPVPTDGATQAFVKHANASQGVTELLLKEAMEKFGAVSHVEIDRRKGFAYVDFIDTEGLKKAMAANPISVGQGTVQVLQRKATALAPEKKPPNNPQNSAPRGGRGGRIVGRRGGRGGGRGIGNAAAEASKAPFVPSGPAAK